MNSGRSFRLPSDTVPAERHLACSGMHDTSKQQLGLSLIEDVPPLSSVHALVPMSLQAARQYGHVESPTLYAVCLTHAVGVWRTVCMKTICSAAALLAAFQFVQRHQLQAYLRAPPVLKAAGRPSLVRHCTEGSPCIKLRRWLPRLHRSTTSGLLVRNANPSSRSVYLKRLQVWLGLSAQGHPGFSTEGEAGARKPGPCA